MKSKYSFIAGRRFLATATGRIAASRAEEEGAAGASIRRCEVFSLEQLYPVCRSIDDPLSIYDDLELSPGQDGAPFVAVNMVSTVDGKITLNKKERAEPIGSPVDRELMKRIRVHFDAVIRGAETVRANPFFPGVPEDLVPRRERAGRSAQVLGVVVSASLDLPLESQYFTVTPRPVVLTTESSDPKRRRAVEEYAHVEVVGEKSVDPERALEVLSRKYGVRTVLVEGGAALNYAFFEKGLIDMLFWTLAPKVGGFDQDLTMVMGPQLLKPVPRLSLESLYVHEDELYFRWRVER